MGDVNCDGYDDILIGAHGNEDSGMYAGQTYLIFGKATGWAKDTNLSASDASFLGEDADDYSGTSVAGAGDVNRDGYDDILIGACYDDNGSNNAGQTYLILGKASGWSMDTSLSASDASFWGEDELDYSGRSVAGAGDVNGDGHDDILIGADGNSEGGSFVGQTYLIFPHNNRRPLLYDEDISQNDSDMYTNHTFSITYRDIDGDEPVEIGLIVDDHWYDMICNDSIPLDFKWELRYSFTLNLAEGFHQYYYSASDGKSPVRFPLDGYLTIFKNVTAEDSDSDGYNDTYERKTGSDPYDGNSTPLDWDGDGWKNSIEIVTGTNPRSYSSHPADLDGDGIPDYHDIDRDGDKVTNANDAYPNDPSRWKSDSDSVLEGYVNLSRWGGLIILVLVLGVFVMAIYVVKKRIAKSKESESDDFGRIGKDD